MYFLSCDEIKTIIIIIIIIYRQIQRLLVNASPDGRGCLPKTCHPVHCLLKLKYILF